MLIVIIWKDIMRIQMESNVILVALIVDNVIPINQIVVLIVMITIFY